MARRLPASALAVLAAVTATAAAAENAPLAPVPLFAAVCTRGGAQLPAADVARAVYAGLPTDARVALGFDLAGAQGMATGMMQPLGARDVPNPVLAVGRGGEQFLLPSAIDRNGALARSCAVVWRGAHFAEARRGVATLAGLRDGGDGADASPVAGAHLFAVKGDGYRLVAGEMAGWTMLRMTLDAPPPPPASAPSPGTIVRDKGRGVIVVRSDTDK